MELEAIAGRLRRFTADREWDVYHTPKNLIMALTGEVGELASVFQWLTHDEAESVMADET